MCCHACAGFGECLCLRRKVAITTVACIEADALQLYSVLQYCQYGCACVVMPMQDLVTRKMSYINLAELTGGAAETWSWSHLKNLIGEDEAAQHFYAGMHMHVLALATSKLLDKHLAGNHDH